MVLQKSASVVTNSEITVNPGDTFPVTVLSTFDTGTVVEKRHRIPVRHFSGELFGNLDGTIYPIFANRKGDFFISRASPSLKDSAKYIVRERSILSVRYRFKNENSFLEPPLFEESQFGTLVKFRASENHIIQVLSCIENAGLKLAMWDQLADQEQSSGEIPTWVARFRQGYQFSTVEAVVLKSLSQVSLESDYVYEAEPTAVSPVPSIDLEISSSMMDFEKIVPTTNLVDDGDDESVDVGLYGKKRSSAEKVLEGVLLATLPNLAFEPGSAKTMLEYFQDSSQLSATLKAIDSGESLPMKKIAGLAGSKGWVELSKHLKTGRDVRGRIYLRRSSKDCLHSFDVVLHWKKNDKQQARLLDKLASYSHFESPEVIKL